MRPEQIQMGLLYFAALAFSLSVHEATHAIMAKLYGDDTAARDGRISLNPLVHFDGLSAIILAMMALQGMGVGWAKPTPVNPLKFEYPRRDVALVALMGPVSNLMLAILTGVTLSVLASSNQPWVHSWVLPVLNILFQVNVSLAAFNLIPVYPLDGAKVLSAMLPAGISRQFDFYWIRMGHAPLLGLIVLEWFLPFPGPISWVIQGAFRLLNGLIF